MKLVRFDKEKDRLLRIKRKIGFLEIIDAIESDKVLKSVSNPNKKKFPNQKMMLISIKRYVYVVPYVENENEERGNSSSNEIESRDVKDKVEIEDEIENEVEDETENESEIGSENDLEKFTHEQEKLQEQVKEQFEKLSERKGVVKTLVGPNYEALLQMQRVMEQNTLMLQQLEQLKTQAATPEETQLVESLTNTLQNQNQALNQRIEKEQETFSIFGWLSKLFLK